MTAVINPFALQNQDNLITTNAGAESAALTDWTSLVGAPAAVTSTAAVAGPRAGSGSYFFTGGAAVRSVMRRNVAVPSGFHAGVDAHSVYAVTRFLNINANTDFSMVSLRFIDAGGVCIGTYAPFDKRFTQTTAWRVESLPAKMPAGTRSIDIDLNFYRLSGTPNDANYDDVELFLTTGLVWPIELPINNPDGDGGNITGWTTAAGNPSVSSAAGSPPLPMVGRFFFYPGTTLASSMTQDIAVPSAAHADVDAGLVTLRWAWFINTGTDTDHFTLAVETYNGSMTLTGSKTPPTASNGGTVFGWTLKTDSFAVPASTRTIRLLANGGRRDGASNDGYSSAYSCRLTK